jgi:hypothetical protein
MRTRIIATCIASVIATFAFMVACGTGPGGAKAEPTCAQWQVTEFDLASDCGGSIPQHANGGTCTLPAGWHPIGVVGTLSTNAVLLGRCAP